MIRHFIRSENTLLLSVEALTYVGNYAGITHTISVVGYTVTKNSTMQVQIIDPSRGIIYIPIEHLTASIIPDDCLIIT